MTPRPTFVSLFSGIGGLDLGLERAGWRCVAQVEVDPFCQRVLAKHWPDVPRWGDIREVSPDDLPRADLVAAGFPCQPVSDTGARLAQADPRWLWPEIARLVRHLRPRFVLLENTPGLLVRGFDDVLGDLAAIGYDAEWSCVSACSVGAPHVRDRVFLLGYPAGKRGRPRLRQAGARQGASRVDLAEPGDAGWRHAAPRVRRVADGAAARLDGSRRRALGNAVVPQVAELIGHRILEAAA